MNDLGTIFGSMAAHPTTWILVVGYLFLAGVGAMPPPGSNKSLGLLLYEFLFDFMHTLANQVQPIVARRAAEQAQAKQQIPIPPGPKTFP